MVSTNNSRERGPLPRRLFGRLRRLPAPVWTLATIFGVGGLMCIFAAAFPISKTAPRELATIVGGCLIVGSLFLLRFGSRFSEANLQALAIGGTLVNGLLISQATTSYGATLNSFAWIWVAIYAGQFFDQRAVRIQVGAIAVVSAVALAICGLPGLVTAWVLVAGSCILAGEALGRLNSRLRTQLVTDPLTGLLNRAGFGGAAERLLALASREQLPISVALIDLDGFKQVNDLNGHAAGDELLVELGRAWAAELRGSEVLARMGGDEFALLLVAEGDAAGDALRRLRAASPVGWSVGMVEWRPGESLEGAMVRADEQLYRAKRLARDHAHERGPTGLTITRQTGEPTTPLV
ncbi:MAG TPA: GGDEF domain-containing protein [Solirubrobacterales bacterium]|nr:GGDEF domain-containing protein [Solirubrobacterales bacterium]